MCHFISWRQESSMGLTIRVLFLACICTSLSDLGDSASSLALLSCWQQANCGVWIVSETARPLFLSFRFWVFFLPFLPKYLKNSVDFFNKQLQWQMADECTTRSSNGTWLRGSQGTVHLSKGTAIVSWEREWESEFLTMVKMFWRRRTWWQGERKRREWLRSS